MFESLADSARAVDARSIDQVLQVLQARWLLTISPWQVIDDGAVAIRDGRIVAVGPAAQLRAEYGDAQWQHFDEHVLMPGLVNAHTHAAMTVLRGFADDLPLMRWLQEHIWPAEARWVGPEFVFDGTRLAAAEMLRGGVTCFNDMYFFPAEAIAACRQLGIRVVSGQVIIDGTTSYADGADEHLRRATEVIEQFTGVEQVHLMLAPHAPYTVSDATFAKIAEMSAESGIRVHTHLHETADEVAGGVAEHGVRPVARLDRLGLVNERLVAAHAVHLDDDEIALFAERDVAIAHCPASNLKLASGIARYSDWLSAGLRVGFGTDGAASNNRLDVLSDMRLASLLQKGVTGDAEAVSARAALTTATLGAADALGLADEIGSVTPGKSADLITVRMSDPLLTPVFDVASHLVNCIDRHHVSDVWVAGRKVVADHRLTSDDDEQLRAVSSAWADRLGG